MTEAFHVGDRVTPLVALPGMPLGTPGRIIAIVPGKPTLYLVQPDNQAIPSFIVSATLLVRVPLAA